MKKVKGVKSALLTSVVSLFLCVTMLVGTTFAWFTDEATSKGNVIQTGELNVEMYWAEGDEDPATLTDWNPASKSIFNNDKWEPGYSEAKHIKIANEGTLALKYQMRIIADGVVSELANVIDVYYFEDAKQLSRADFVEDNKLGTLYEVLNVEHPKNLSKTVAGSLERDESKIVTLALKMQDGAGNEYQNKAIGTSFTIQIIATQYTVEEDSFDNSYDGGADFAPQKIPAANVYAYDVSGVTVGGEALDVGFSFQPTETYEQAQASEYRWGHADFFVYADRTVPANSLALAGYYNVFDGLTWGGQTCSPTSWIGLSADTDVEGGEANGVRLLGDGMGMPGVSYSEICNYGNDGTGFLCGAADLTGANEGTTLYVELRVYKVACDDPGCHHNKFDCETGEYVTVGKFEYTFGGSYVTLADGSEVFMAKDGEVILSDVSAVDTATYYVPDGVTALGNYAFTDNDTITEVVVSDTVTSLGRAFDSNTTIKKVVLNEGLETIDSRAFKATTALEEVVIPSTVKTIADNAFQKSGIKNIVIPATVETIGETAFGASLIETVTFEGNTSVQGYAFRGCPNLKTVIIYGDDVEFIPSTLNGRNSTWFCNNESNNPNASDIDFHVVNDTMKERVLVAMGAERDNTDVYVDITVVSNDSELLAAVQNATDKTATILLSNGTYSGNLDLTVAALGSPLCEELIFKATGDNVVIAGTVTIGYREQNVGAASYNAKITFDGITFDHAEAGNHCLNVQDVESFYMVNCTVIGDGEYGLSTPGGNGTGAAKIENCKFVNAGLQIAGKFAQTLVIDCCEFEESVVNVQGGGPLGPTIQNSKFDITLTEAHSGESFYVIRNSNAGANIKVEKCEINVDAEEGFDGVAGSKGWGVFVNRIASYDINANNVTITMTDAALAQNALKVATCLSTGKINMTNVTVNGVEQ